MIFTKGKYKGYKVHEVPVSYLAEYITKEKRIPSDLLYAIRNELHQRLNISIIDLGGINNLTCQRKIEEIQSKYHGNPDALQAINELVENIKPYI